MHNMKTWYNNIWKDFRGNLIIMHFNNSRCDKLHESATRAYVSRFFIIKFQRDESFRATFEYFLSLAVYT